MVSDLVHQFRMICLKLLSGNQIWNVLTDVPVHIWVKVNAPNPQPQGHTCTCMYK